MMYLSLLILVYFSIVSPGAAQEEADPEFCTVFDSLTEVTKEETQVEAISTIIDDIAPGISEALQLSLLENVNNSNSSMSPLQVAYNTLAESFDARPNVAGYNKFVEAVNEISLAQAEACNDPTFVPTIELITKLAGEFENATFGPEVDLTKARSAFGKLLCLNTREGNAGESVRKRRQTNNNCDDVTCSEEARNNRLHKVESVCEFFVCLQAKSQEDIRQLGPVFGFASATATDDECLAFIVDTTGSMSGEIEAAKQIILNFIASEDNAGELQCYVLVPFNDFDDVDSSQLDYGPITVVYTSMDVGDLAEFVAAVNNLEANGGGDSPEYATDGILAGLRVTVLNDKLKEINIMTRGSQMIVLTDALTKNEQLEADIIGEANQRGVCIHFLISRNTNLVSNSIYQRIAEGTSGTIGGFSEFTFSDFVASYQKNPCDKLAPGQKRSISKRSITRSKRQATPGGMCKNFYVSSFAYLLKLSIEVNNRAVVNITQPNGTVYQAFASSRGLAVFSQAMPTGGQWKACVNYNFGRLEVALSQDIAFDTSVLFINEGSEMPSTTPPPLCTQLVQLASFFAGTDARTQTSRNDITCVDANRHGDLFAVGVHKRIKIYSYKDTLLRSPSRIHFPLADIHSEGKIKSLKFAHVNTHLAYGDSTGQIGVLDTASGNQRFKCVIGHTESTSSLAYTICGRLLISGGGQTVKIWINETLHNIFTLDTKQQVVSVCPHLVYTHLLAYTTNDAVCYIDLRNPKTHLFKHDSQMDLKKATFISDTEIVSVNHASDELHLLDIQSLNVTRQFKDPMYSNHFTGIDVLNGSIACGCASNSVYIFHKDWSLPQNFYLIKTSDPSEPKDLPSNITSFLGSAGWQKPDQSEYVTSVCWIKDNHVLVAHNNGFVNVIKR